MGKTKYLLTIDPGTKRLGWAIFEFDYRFKIPKVCLYRSGFIAESSKTKDWIERIDLMTKQILGICQNLIFYSSEIKILIELPTNFAGSSKGAAALNSGSVGKLMACVFQLKGAISHVFPSFDIQLISVRTWKGNVPKTITEKRILKYWGRKGKVNDESDAIGIGDWYIRNILKYQPIKS